MKILDDPYTTTVTGKLQITIPAQLARKYGIQVGMRLIWRPSDDPQVITAQVVPDPIAGLREAQKIVAKNKQAAAKLMKTFEEERAWQRANGTIV